MKKKLLFLLVFILLLIPINSLALSKNYTDKVSKYTNTKVEKDKVNLYLFRGEGCPHCKEEEEWLKDIKDDYKDKLNIYDYEVWYNKDNAGIMKNVAKEFNTNVEGVPFTVIGNKYYIGFSDTQKSSIQDKIDEYLEINPNSRKVNLPILGKVDKKDVSLPVVAVVLGLIDGFNPCAMWILLFLISMLFGMKNRKRSIILGVVFLTVSGLVYLLSMLGINMVLQIATISILKLAIGLFILGAGIYNFRKYLRIKDEEAGCEVVDDKKRKKLITKINKITHNKSFILALLGISVLAISVNLIELACSLGFPVIFTELLAVNKVTGILRIIYLLIYIFCYMLDDMVIFIVSMATLELTGVTNKYTKITTLISSIIMIIMGLLMLFKPSWLMLNF